MIARFFAILILLYLLGFIVFSVTLGAPAKGEHTDAVVVITGGSGRIERAIDVLAKGYAKRMLISGTDPSVTKADLVRRLGGKKKLVDCCVDLGSESVDTRSNAEEARRWLDKHRYKSFRLVTSDWHMASRSTPVPKEKPCHSSGSRPQAVITFGCTIPEPRTSIQPSLPPTTRRPFSIDQPTSTSADGSVKGK